MTPPRPRLVHAARPATGDVIRMDWLDNPFGPSIAVYEALAGGATPVAASDVRQALGRLVGTNPRQVMLGSGIEELVDALFRWRAADPIVVFPPTAIDVVGRAKRTGAGAISVRRGARFGLDLELDLVADLPPESWAYVMSPNEPTGNLLDVPDAIRLARACSLLVIDERHGGYAGRSLVPLAREFDNVLVLQTLETWAGLSAFPVAYAVGQTNLLKQFGASLTRSEIADGMLMAAMATLRDLGQVRANVQRIRKERSRLFRTLRKLNMVSPLPSWGNFLLMRAERGTATAIQAGLAERGVVVYHPPQPELARYLRVTAGLPEQTDALKRALIDLGVTL